MASTYELSHSTLYRYSGMVSMCQNQLRLTPRIDSFQQLIKWRLEVSPKPSKIVKSIDFFQNQINYFELHQPHDALKVTMQAIVQVAREPQDPTRLDRSWESMASELASDHSPSGIERAQFALYSPLVPFCEDASSYAKESFLAGRGLMESAIELNHRIHRDFRYDPLATTIHTPIEEVFRMRRGVCQDLAHVMLACFRSLGLAARYVSGYLRTYPPQDPSALVGADASHAWVSFYAGESGWIDVDPTNDLIVQEEHITLAWGRDFRDVTPINGLYVGAEQQSLEVAVKVRPV